MTQREQTARLVELYELLRRCIPHVYRQRYHGRHTQDRKDAEALWVDLEREGLVDPGHTLTETTDP